MVFLLCIGGCAVLIGGIGAIVWGWPGETALLALLPAVVVGGTAAHVVRARQQRQRPRVGVVVIGAMLGIGFTFVTMLVFRAAMSPVETVIERSVRVEAPVELVWRTVGAPDQRPRWHSWVRELEPIGDPEEIRVGSRYRTVLDAFGRHLAVEQSITDYREGAVYAWRVHFGVGTEIEDFRERLQLEPGEAGDTRVTYRIEYRVPTVVGRLFDGIEIRPGFEQIVEQSLARLAEVATQ